MVFRGVRVCGRRVCGRGGKVIGRKAGAVTGFAGAGAAKRANVDGLRCTDDTVKRLTAT